MSILATAAMTAAVFAWMKVVELRARVDDMEAWFYEAGVAPPVGPERAIMFPHISDLRKRIDR